MGRRVVTTQWHDDLGPRAAARGVGELRLNDADRPASSAQISPSPNSEIRVGCVCAAKRRRDDRQLTVEDRPGAAMEAGHGTESEPQRGRRRPNPRGHLSSTDAPVQPELRF